ncbi:DUF3908 family protein [Aquibacillus kalidii]|uniref:DUF3908 family protein n=1 Tax=Aquibacillus kalidii TaxID=2762597 RepID=UPI0016457DEC|nr:DUF3908 family protein [Aquibacillus kalidii]
MGLTDGIKYFYPKGLFVENKPLELFFFYNDKVFVVRFFKDDKTYQIKTIRYNQIPEIIFNANNSSFRELRLKGDVLEERPIILQSLNDTNDAWKNEFARKIENIYSLLS